MSGRRFPGEECFWRFAGRNPEAIDTLAVAEWKLGKPEDASQRLEEALTKFPTHLQSSVTLTRMKLIQKDWKGAEEVLAKAVAAAPQSSPAAQALGELYVVLRQLAAAESQFSRAVQLDPKNGPALMAWHQSKWLPRRMDEAERTLKQLAALPEKAYKPLHAIFLYQIGKRDAALAEFEALVKSAPDDREPRSRLVAAYLDMNRISEAEAVLGSAVKRNAKDTDALLQRAELRLRSGKAGDAEKDLKVVLQFKPDSALAHFLLAAVYRAKGLQNSQQQELLEAVRLNPAMLRARLALEMGYLAAKQGQAALDVMDAAPDTQKNQLPWLIGRNWALLSLGKLNEAKAGVERALQQGNAPDAVFQSAYLRFVQRDYPGARVQLEELLKGDAPDVRAAQLMAETYAAQKQPSKAVERLTVLAAAHPSSAPLQHLLGQWYARTGNAAGARKAFANARAADPHFVAADLSLAELDIQEGRNDAARQKLGAVLTADPNNVPALLLAAQADDGAGDHAAVIARYRAVLNVDRSNPIALNNLAYALAPNDPDEALKLAQQAAEVAPDSPNIQDTLGWVYYRKGLYSMAVRHLKASVDKESTPRRQFHLGMSYLKVGDQAKGQKLVRDAIQKEPNLARTEQGW